MYTAHVPRKKLLFSSFTKHQKSTALFPNLANKSLLFYCILSYINSVVFVYSVAHKSTSSIVITKFKIQVKLHRLFPLVCHIIP